MTAKALSKQLEYMANRLRNGCGNGGCIVKPPDGMHTNSGCSCFPSKYAKHLLGLSIECEDMGHEWDREVEG